MELHQHLVKWTDCDRCPLHLFRKRVVHYRGNIPAPILYFGMAPGVSEDTLGEVMIGPTKDILDRLNQRMGIPDDKVCYINAVGCRSSVSATVNRDPTEDEIAACAQRVEELCDIIQPQLLIALGNVAATALPHNVDIIIRTVHPAFILRTGGTHRFNRHWRRMCDDVRKGIDEIDFHHFRSYTND